MSDLLYLTGKSFCVLSIPIEKAKKYGIDTLLNTTIEETATSIIVKRKKVEGVGHQQPRADSTQTHPLETDESYEESRESTR